MDYVHSNPVKHGFVAHPADWPYSTFRKCVALGLYDPAWAPAENENTSSGMGDRS
jgi:putative transposase